MSVPFEDRDGYVRDTMDNDQDADLTVVFMLASK